MSEDRCECLDWWDPTDEELDYLAAHGHRRDCPHTTREVSFELDPDFAAEILAEEDE